MRPRLVRIMARAQIFSTATRVHVQVVLAALRVRSVRNLQIEPPLKQSDSFADKYFHNIQRKWLQM